LFAISGCDTYFKSELRRLRRDRQRQPAYEIFSKKVEFNCLRFDSLGSKSPPYKGIKFGYPFQNARFQLLLCAVTRLMSISSDFFLLSV